MHLALAQQLVYGRGEHKATGIVLQLASQRRHGARRARGSSSLSRKHKLDLEVRDFARAQSVLRPGRAALRRDLPVHRRSIMGVIVLFAVVNTMTMNVMERTNEIGTIARAGRARAASSAVSSWPRASSSARSAPPPASILALPRGIRGQPRGLHLDPARQRQRDPAARRSSGPPGAAPRHLVRPRAGRDSGGAHARQPRGEAPGRRRAAARVRRNVMRPLGFSPSSSHWPRPPRTRRRRRRSSPRRMRCAIPASRSARRTSSPNMSPASRATDDIARRLFQGGSGDAPVPQSRALCRPPRDAGKMVLLDGHVLWFYDPSSKASACASRRSSA